jgi:hypothetical protein
MDFTGSWKNQHGSVLELQMDGEQIRGRFESGVGEWDSDPHWIEVSGKAQEDLITFCASFRTHGSLVSWVGRHTLRDGADQIQAEWLHITNVPHDREGPWLWSANRIGFDTFERT